MENYDTVSAALNSLKLQGYTIDFNIAFDKRIVTEGNLLFSPEDFIIVKVFRFEGASNPDDEAVVYAIESKDGDVKGVMVSAFGAYADPVSNAIIQKLAIHPDL